MNKTQKETLVARTLEQKGKKQLTALTERLKKLANELYDEAIPKAPSNDPAWVLHLNDINIDHNGFVRYLGKFSHKLQQRSLSIGVSRPFPQEYRYDKTVRPSAKLSKKFDTFITDLEKHKDEQAQVERDLNALLATVKTYKQLTVAWPEGLELYKDFQPESASRALVDPSVIQRLNKELVK